MNLLPTDRLDHARQALAALHVRACRISHERVLVSDGSPLRRTIGEEKIFVRVGLFSPEDRIGQLSCAHTTARHDLQNIVRSLAELKVLPSEEAAAIHARINELADVIHAADWSRGALEAAYATAAESNDTAACDEHAQAIAQLERQHTVASTELAEILSRVRRLADA